MSTISSSSAVDGLISGLDTASIISKLVAVDAAPQNTLKNNVSTATARSMALQSVNAKMKAVADAAGAFKDASGWNSFKAASSGASVVATATKAATAGEYLVRVDSLASGKSIVSQGSFKENDDAAATLGFPLDVKIGDKTVTINKTSGTLKELTEAINAVADLGVKAVAIRVTDGSYRLQITSTKTGLDGGFELVPRDTGKTESTGFQGLTPAAQAKLVVLPPGDPFNAGIPVTSNTNTFSEVLPGVSFTATSASPDAVKVTVARDTEGMATAMESLVAAANAALSEIAKQSQAGSIGSDGKVSGGGILRGDNLLRSLSSQVIQAVTSALSDGSSAASFGLESTRDGQLKFTKGTFVEALEKDPAKAQELLAPKTVDPTTSKAGVIDRLLAVANAASDKYTGTLTAAVKGQDDKVADLQGKIADWDVRLAAKRARYQAYYARLEVSLGKLQSQSTWLSGQLANLAGSNS